MKQISTLKIGILKTIMFVFVFGGAFAQPPTIFSTDCGTTSGTFPSGISPSGGSTQYSCNTTSASGSGFSGSCNISNGTNATATVVMSGLVSTVGYTDVTIIWAARMTSTGASPSFYWSSNGTTWNAVSFTDVSNNSTWAWVNGGTAISLPSGAEGVSNLQFKWVSGSNANTYRMDDIKIQGCIAPTTQASAITFSAVGSTSMVINWTNGNGTNRVVKMNSSNSFTAPSDGTSPSASTSWSNSGEQVVYNGGSNSVNVTNLSTSTTYWFRVYENNCSGSTSKYITSTATNNPNSQTTSAVSSVTDYFRSKQTGDWNNFTTWESSSDNTNWISATIYPKYTANIITIQSGHVVTLTATDTIDQVTINGKLTYADIPGSTPRINNAPNSDLIINGTFEDFGPNSISWATSATWTMGSNGTMIRTRSTSSDNWRDKYDGGMTNMPATANWILRKNSTDTPTLSTTCATYYPNLTFENTTGSTWVTGQYSSFTGYVCAPTIKGNLDIGGSGTAGVSFKHENTNSAPALVKGNLTIQSGSTLRNYGTGFEIQGNLVLNGTLDNGTGTPKFLLTGTANQTIAGSSIEFKNFELNKSNTNATITLNSPVAVSGTFTFTKGYLITSSTNVLEFGAGSTASGAKDSSFVSGPVKKTGDSDFEFPVGKGKHYQSIAISAPMNVTDAFTAEYFNTGQTYGLNHDTTFDYISQCEYHTLNRTAGTSTVIPTLSFDMFSCVTFLYPSPRVGLWDGTKWTDQGIGSLNAAAFGGTINAGAALSTYGPIALVNNSKDKFAPVDTETVSNAMSYIQNNGQLISTIGATRSDIKYYSESSYPNTYLTNDSLFYVFSHIDTSSSTLDTMVRVGVSFVNGIASHPVAQNQSESRSNYFLSHCSSGVTSVPSFQRVTYGNIYNKIDVVYSTNTAGTKYSFHIRPRGLPRSICQKYDGADSVKVLGDGRLCIYTALEELILQAPVAFSIDSSFNLMPVVCNWLTIDTLPNHSFFEFPNDYNGSLPMIIQIEKGNIGNIARQSIDNLKWSTFWGGSGTDVFYDITSDNLGNTYIAGNSNHSSFPHTSGSLYTFAGGGEAIIIKTNNLCEPVWTNYYGGSGGDAAYGVTLDSQGNVIIVGKTDSKYPNDIPFSNTGGVFSNQSNSGIDGFIAKFNNAGNSLLWGTYYGGANEYYLSFLKAKIDAQDNLIVVGSGASSVTPINNPSSFDVSSGKGIILKFDNQGNIIFTSRWGYGVYDVAIDNQNDIYVTGYSNNNQITTVDGGGGVLSNGGGADILVTKIDHSTNQLIWSTYFGGSGYDLGEGIAIDNSNHYVYVAGRTRTDQAATTPFPVKDFNTSNTTDFYESNMRSTTTLPNSTDWQDDACILKFNSQSGENLWSTYFGGLTVDMAHSVKVDANGYVYIVGSTKSGAGLYSNHPAADKIEFPYAAPNYYVKDDISGIPESDGDGFLLMFDSNSNLLWTTYYGCGDQSSIYAGSQELLYGLTVVNNSDVYIVGYAWGVATPASLPPIEFDPSPNSTLDHFQQASAGGYEGIIARFDVSNKTGLGFAKLSNDANKTLSIYPNPSTDICYVKINHTNSSINKVQVIIYNELGQPVIQQSAILYNNAIKIDTKKLASGFYTIKLVTESNSYSGKLIKN